jgi:hypothetical protein
MKMLSRLLDGPAVKDEQGETKEGPTHLSNMTRIDNTLIANTYDAELSGLQESSVSVGLAYNNIRAVVCSQARVVERSCSTL